MTSLASSPYPSWSMNAESCPSCASCASCQKMPGAAVAPNPTGSDWIGPDRTGSNQTKSNRSRGQPQFGSISMSFGFRLVKRSTLPLVHLASSISIALSSWGSRSCSQSFRASHPTGLSGPDGWLRRRLRALLRKREKRPGDGTDRRESLCPSAAICVICGHSVWISFIVPGWTGGRPVHPQRTQRGEHHSASVPSVPSVAGPFGPGFEFG
jgi:hypothetical protein